MEPIKVLQFICPTGFYGAERWILALANNTDSNRVINELVVTKESDKQNLEIIRQFKGEAFELPMTGRFDLSVVSRLVALIKERNIKIIHTHGYKSDILGLLAAKKAGIRCVCTPHGFGEAKDFKLKLYIRLGGFCLKFFDRVVPLSKQLYAEVRQLGVNKNRLHYIQNGVDLTEIDPYLEAKKISDSEVNKNIRIGFVGQMIPRKKIHFILDIFDSLWKKHPELVLELLGEGQSKEELEAYANTLSARSNIYFLGFRNDRLEKLSKFDLFVMTSSSEGIPRCLMEAMAMEVPVAAFDISGIDQLITHNSTGLLAPYGDVVALKSCWEKLLDDTKVAKGIGMKAREFVLENFSARRMAQEYTELFEAIV